MTTESPTDGEPHEEFESQFSDLAEGTLAPAERARLEAHLAGCAACRAAHADFKRTLDALGSLHRHAAPQGLPAEVVETIHRRSGGRFFGRRAFGDRIPFELVGVLALVVVLILYLLVRNSATGSLHRGHELPRPPAEGEAAPR